MRVIRRFRFRHRIMLRVHPANVTAPWRCFVTWTKETIGTELADLLAGYGTKLQTNFS